MERETFVDRNRASFEAAGVVDPRSEKRYPRIFS
jgi:hypothetical protein